MFEDDVTVPAGWYPDPMGLPQLRWWNNHAWTELTTEARPPLVVQSPTRLAFADDELPTRRQQREQRERDEEYATLATDENEARDAAAAHAPLTVTLREIDAPLSGDIEDEPVAEESVREQPVADEPVALIEPPSAEPVDDIRSRLVNLDTIDYDSVASDDDAAAFLPRPAFVPIVDSPAAAEPTVEGPVETAADAGIPDAVLAPEPAVSAASADRLAAPPVERGFDGRPHSGRTIYTASVWIIALIPLLLLVVSLLLLLGFGSSLNMWVTPAIWALSWIVVVILAITDRAALGRAGYEHRASWAWALLTAPIYLIARSMSLAKVGPLGFAPVLVWAALGILQIGSVLVVPGLIISALPHVFATQAEQSIASDASIIGAKLSVKCSPDLPVLVGQTFDCVATADNETTGGKDHYNLTVLLQRTNGWIDWHVSDWGYLHGAPTT
ncbi:DUF2510 domain-containing protein [Lacisediminihabitans sp. FW035]